jgi:hypothetical protein
LSLITTYYNNAQNISNEAQGAAIQTQNELNYGDFQGMNPGYFDSLINSALANAGNARAKANETAQLVQPILNNYANLRTQNSSVDSALQQLSAKIDDALNKASGAQQAALSTVDFKAYACNGTGYC